MVTTEHESPIKIIRDNPEVLVQLMKLAFGIDAGPDLTIRSASEACTQLAPVSYTADNVVEICEGTSTEPTLSIVAETQRAVDHDKCGSWPLYVTSQWAKTRAPCYLVVICPRPAVAEWAREPIKLGHPGFELTPLVLGPGSEPLITSTEQAAQMPELTILCTLANVTPHTRESMEIAHAALATIENEDAKTGALYTGILMAVLAQSAKKLLEEYVITGTPDFKFENDPFRPYVAEGEAKGEVRGEAKAVLKVLAARGVSVPDDARERVLACEDTEQLDRWLARAVTAESVDDVFG
ncbi:hypothetical protein [Actinomadura madurae]|uniref:hypothetical protein n=1 Tax=Actinomadura madurae TaxID=1993 RepID=UPI000DA07D6B|nr:hypothetical protein [Actinomadura madurae]SPT58414.1 Uncharacterised protein [Actinomadura madurae]